MKSKQIALLAIASLLILAGLCLGLNIASIQVRLNGWQLELVRVIKATATPALIDVVDVAAGWETYTDDKGSSVSIGPVAGRTGDAIEISFDLKEGGWVGLLKRINPDVLPALSGLKSLRFSYQGSGASNTIEFKLLYKQNDEGQHAIYSVLWPRATEASDWKSLGAPVSAFSCWAGTGCQPGENLDLEQVQIIDFAISNKPGDEPGRGVVIIDDVQGIR